MSCSFYVNITQMQHISASCMRHRHMIRQPQETGKLKLHNKSAKKTGGREKIPPTAFPSQSLKQFI